MAGGPAPEYRRAGEVEPEYEGRFAKKLKESPMMVAGIGGWIGIVAFGLYSIKTRDPKISLAMHLIHTRVIAQTAVIGGVTLGVSYQLAKGLADKWWPAETASSSSTEAASN